MVLALGAVVIDVSGVGVMTNALACLVAGSASAASSSKSSTASFDLLGGGRLISALSEGRSVWGWFDKAVDSPYLSTARPQPRFLELDYRPRKLANRAHLFFPILFLQTGLNAGRRNPWPQPAKAPAQYAFGVAPVKVGNMPHAPRDDLAQRARDACRRR
jgi:hypothetical protein